LALRRSAICTPRSCFLRAATDERTAPRTLPFLAGAGGAGMGRAGAAGADEVLSSGSVQGLGVSPCH
jgi:hypothetical protein